MEAQAGPSSRAIQITIRDKILSITVLLVEKIYLTGVGQGCLSVNDLLMVVAGKGEMAAAQPGLQIADQL